MLAEIFLLRLQTRMRAAKWEAGMIAGIRRFAPIVLSRGPSGGAPA